jgi:hypothetical protein
MFRDVGTLRCRQPSLGIEKEGLHDEIGVVMDGVGWDADIDARRQLQAERWDGKSSFEDLTR